MIRAVRPSNCSFRFLWFCGSEGHRPLFEVSVSPMKQTNFFKPSRKEHGGILALNTRRSRRPLSIKHPLHLTLRSDFAYGPRSLIKHHALINHIGRKFSRRFGVRIYRQAICGNHLHLLLRGTSRVGLQNFFRVFAGHIAQQILGTAPIAHTERCKVRGGAPVYHKVSKKTLVHHSEPSRCTVKPGLSVCSKNQRRFWALLIYTRLLTWGREFHAIAQYFLQNTLEAFNLIAYKPRSPSRKLKHINTA